MTAISKLIAINNYQEFRKNIQDLFKMSSNSQDEVQEDDQQQIYPNHKYKAIQDIKTPQKSIKIQLIQDDQTEEKMPYKEIKIRNRYNLKNVIHLEQEIDKISSIENDKISNDQASQITNIKSTISLIQQLFDFNLSNAESQRKINSFFPKEKSFVVKQKDEQNLLLREELLQIDRDTFDEVRRDTTEPIYPKDRLQNNTYKSQVTQLNKEIQTIQLDDIKTTQTQLFTFQQPLLPCKTTIKNDFNQAQVSTPCINIKNTEQQDDSLRKLNQIGQSAKSLNNTIKITLQEIKTLLKQLPTRKNPKQIEQVKHISFKKLLTIFQQDCNQQLQKRKIYNIKKRIQAVDLSDVEDRPSSPIQKLIQLQLQEQLCEISQRKFNFFTQNKQNIFQKIKKEKLNSLIQLQNQKKIYPQQSQQEISDQQCSETNFNDYLSQITPYPSVPLLDQTSKVITSKKSIKNNKITQRAIRQELQEKVSILQCIHEDGNDMYLWRTGSMEVNMSFQQAFQKLPYMYLLLSQQYSPLLRHYSLHQISNHCEQIEVDQIILNQAFGGLQRGFNFCKLTRQKQNKYRQAIKNIVRIFKEVLQHKFRVIFLQNISKQNTIVRVQRSKQMINLTSEQSSESLLESQYLPNSKLFFQSLNFKQQIPLEQNISHIQLAATLSRSEYKKLMELNTKNDKQVIVKVKLIGQQLSQDEFH